MDNYRAIPEGYMRIGEIAKKAGINTNTLRHYDKEGLLSPSSESDGGYRLYTDKDMVQLIQILTMKQLGFTLNEIKNHLVSLDTPSDMVNALGEHKIAIEKKIKSLTESLKEIKALKSEVEQMQTMDFRKYADILQTLQMGNEHYWVIKHMDDDVFDHFRNNFDEDSAAAFMEALERLDNEAAQLQKDGISPESEKGQALGKATLEIMVNATGGNESLMKKFAGFIENMKDLHGEQEEKGATSQEFLQLAVDAYLIKSGHDPFV
jgi:DNA-binding transcriptional MerR regulator